jgi:3(or 17)beta-hydroxysteroid dehydrogenase
MQQRLGGKVALVTGGTSGIGAAAVRRMVAEGAQVVFTGSNADAAAVIAQETGASFRSHRVQDAAAWDGLMQDVAADFGRLDIAFANAGTEAGDASVEDIGIDAWNHIVAVNQTGVMLTIQHAIRAMAANPDGARGSIIVNSSMNALRAMGNYAAYSVTKAAVVALVKSAAIHCAQKGYAIRVNAILPGVVDTEGMAPMRRMAQLDEISALVAFLASDEAGFISGSEYVIDGATTAGMMGV